MTSVYFIQCRDKNGPIKIGLAMDVEKRLAQLQVGNPYKLKVIASFYVDSKIKAQQIEKSLHKKFMKHSIRGEWFTSNIKLCAVAELSV